MGSTSDLPTMEAATTILDEFGVPYEVRIISAHRTPERMMDYGHEAVDRGLEVIIAGAGGAAHLPGMLAATTTLPVIGVPVPLGGLSGVDALLSIVQMPKGCPVATVAVGQAANAAHLALRMLAIKDPELRSKLADRRKATAEKVAGDDERVRNERNGGR